MELINFAIDFGNGYVKAKSEKGEFVFSSKLGYASDLGTSSIGNMFADDADVHYFQRKDEIEYVAGKDIEKVIEPAKLVTTNSANNRYELPSFKRLIDFALAELASYEDSNNIEVRLVTGMPSNEIRMAQKRDAFEKFLSGSHLVSRDGEEYIINVRELKIIEQPLGTLLNVFLNDQLQVHKTFKNGLIVVIDFGSGTTIVDIYKNMKRIGGRTLNEGMIHFHKSIADILSGRQSIEIDSQYIEDGIKNKSYIAKVGNEAFHFEDIFKEMVHKKLESVIQVYENTIGQEAIVNDFILTGGGSLMIGEQLQEIKGNFRVVDNPQVATASGYFKLAQSLRKAEVNE